MWNRRPASMIAKGSQTPSPTPQKMSPVCVLESWKNVRNTGKVREFLERKKVGTLSQCCHTKKQQQQQQKHPKQESPPA